MLYEKTDLKNDLGIQKIEMELPTIWNEEKPLASVSITLTDGEKLTDFYLNQYDCGLFKTGIEVKIPIYAWAYINRNHPISEKSYDELENLLLATYKEAESYFSEVQIKDERSPAEKLILKADEAFNTIFSNTQFFKDYLDIMASFPNLNVYNQMAVFIQKCIASDLRTLNEWKNEGFLPINEGKKVFIVTKDKIGYNLAEYYDISDVYNPTETITVEDVVLRGKEPSVPKSRQVTLSENKCQWLNKLTKSSNITQSIAKIVSGYSNDKVFQNVIGYVLAKHYNLDTNNFNVGTFVMLKERCGERKSVEELKPMLINCHTGVKTLIKQIDLSLKKSEKRTVKNNENNQSIMFQFNTRKTS